MRDIMYYVLDANGVPVPESNRLKWNTWMATAERHVAHHDIGDVHVSTAFLGLDHAFGDGPPLLFETMIFGGQHDQYQERYATREEAVAGHARALALVR